MKGGVSYRIAKPNTQHRSKLLPSHLIPSTSLISPRASPKAFSPLADSKKDPKQDPHMASGLMSPPSLLILLIERIISHFSWSRD